MAHRDDEKLLAAWAPPDFASAVATVAEATGVSRSELIREALLRVALLESEADDDGVD